LSRTSTNAIALAASMVAAIAVVVAVWTALDMWVLT
jgi:hypothetical protein